MMNREFLTLIVVFLFCLTANDLWGASVKHGDTNETGLIAAISPNAFNDDKPEREVRRVCLGQEFDIRLPGYYWKYDGFYGFEQRSSWYQGNDTLFRFRVNTWYMGDNLTVTFQRTDGKIIQYEIVRAD